MSAPSVRAAAPSDIESIALISASRAHCAGWSHAQFGDELTTAGARLLVVEEKQQVWGYIALRVVDDEIRVIDLAVSPSRERMGYARALLAGAIASGRRADCRRLTLEVSVANAGALALYKSAGLVVVGRRPKFYNDGSDAILMDLPL